MARHLKLYIVALCLLLPASLIGQSLSAELNEAYYRNSYRQTEQYFHKWLKKSKPANMDTVNDTMRHTYKLFDIYEGAQIKDGYKSVAYSISFRAKDRTLEDKDISPVMEKIYKDLSDAGIELRM